MQVPERILNWTALLCLAITSLGTLVIALAITGGVAVLGTPLERSLAPALAALALTAAGVATPAGLAALALELHLRRRQTQNTRPASCCREHS